MKSVLERMAQVGLALALVSALVLMAYRVGHSEGEIDFFEKISEAGGCTSQALCTATLLIEQATPRTNFYVNEQVVWTSSW